MYGVTSHPRYRLVSRVETKPASTVSATVAFPWTDKCCCEVKGGYVFKEIFIDTKEKRYEQDLSLYWPNYCATQLVVPLVVVYPYIYESTSPRCVLIYFVPACPHPS